MSINGQLIKINKKFIYDKGVRLTNTDAEYPTVGNTKINEIHYNNNEWMDSKDIGDQKINYGYTQRGWLNMINGLNSTYPEDFVPCDEDNPGLDCVGPYTVTDVKVLLDCIDLGLGNPTSALVQITGSSVSQNAILTSDTISFIFPFNGGSMTPLSNYPNQFSTSALAGLSSQPTIEEIIEEIIDCLESNQEEENNDVPDIASLQIQNQYALNNLATMIGNALNVLSGASVDPGNGTSTPPEVVESLFGMKLYYEEGNGELEAPDQYNGNISWMEWRNAGEIKHQYGFDYDGVNRLLHAKYKGKNEDNCKEMPEGAYDVLITGYDEMGNIMGINRKGLTDIIDDIPQYGQIDQMKYTYNPGSNLLGSVEESSNTNHGFKNSTSYSYDDTGNLISNGDNITNIRYSDYLDLPLLIEGPKGMIRMVYDANGRKLQQSYFKDGVQEKEYTYLDGVEFKDGKLESIYHEEGRIVYDGEIPNELNLPTMTYREYFLKDHLGNTRVRYVDKNGDGLIWVDTTDQKRNELTGSYHYYPFGMQWEYGTYRRDPINPPPGQGNFFYNQDVLNKYRYNGKEFIEEYDIGMYDYGARWYDPSIGRFLSVDPLAEKFGNESPYVYAGNNPLLYIDFDGREKIIGLDKNKKSDQNIIAGAQKYADDGAFDVAVGDC